VDHDDTIEMIRRSAICQGARGETPERIASEPTTSLMPRWSRRVVYVKSAPANHDHYPLGFTAEFARAYRHFHLRDAFARIRKAVRSALP
jgi:hypothetical protein